MRANYSVESCLLLNQSTASRTIENIEILTTLFHFLRQHMNSIFFRNVFFARNVVRTVFDVRTRWSYSMELRMYVRICSNGTRTFHKREPARPYPRTLA